MRIVQAAAFTMCVAALTACTANGPSRSAPTGVLPPAQATPVAFQAGNPEQLVGTWRVAAPGEASGAVLIVGDRVDGGDQRCFQPRRQHPHPLPAWMPQVVTWSAQGQGVSLLDAHGDVVATLTRGGRPTVGPNRVPEFAEPPLVTADMRRSWREPSALPPGVTATTSNDVVGRWVPLDRRPATAFIAFDRDGHYRGSDGCNQAGGTYLLGPDGLVLTTSGLSTLIGCMNSPLPDWVGMSGRLGMRQGRLVFVDPHGHVLGEARRA